MAEKPPDPDRQHMPRGGEFIVRVEVSKMCVSRKSRVDHAQGNGKIRKLRWKRSQNGNACLSFYGLKVTVFQNRRQGGWTVSVSQNGQSPTYLNYRSEAEARAAAEQEFLRLKPDAEFEEKYVGLTCSIVRETEAAALIRVVEDGRLYWVPFSQIKEDAEDDFDGYGLTTLVVTRWWWENAGEAEERGW